MKLNDKQKILGVFGILSLVLIAVGVSVAFFTYSKDGVTENTIKSGSITFLYDEINQSGNSIGITDALPISDTKGKAGTNYFNFKIVSNSSNTNTIPYEITLRQKQGTDDIGNKVKVYLSKIDSYNSAVNTEEEITTSLFSSLQTVTHNNYSEKLLHTDIVPASDTRYEQYYRLKMWLDESATLSSTEETFTVTVNVYANGHVLDASSSNNEITSLSVGGTPLTVKSTENNIDYYETTLPEGTTQTTITVETSDYTRTRITKTQSDYQTPIASSNNITKLSNTLNKTVNLTEGANYFKIITISEDNTEKESHMSVNVERSIQIFGQNYGVINEKFNRMWNTNIPVANPGLYVSTETNSGDPTYYFSGIVENNYVLFGKYTEDIYYGYYRNKSTHNFRAFSSLSACQSDSTWNKECSNVHSAGEYMKWRIVRINEDGTIRLILSEVLPIQTRINQSLTGTQNMYYSNGTTQGNSNYPNARYVLLNWYSLNIGNNPSYASKIATGNYFCEAAKAGTNTETGTTFMTESSEYLSDFTCNLDGNGYQYVNDNVGLLSYDEAMHSGMTSSNSKNSYLDIDESYWTMSPGGKQTGTDNAHAWIIYRNYLSSYYANNGDTGGLYVRPVINLKADVTATGTGTSSDPYVIQ